MFSAKLEVRSNLVPTRLRGVKAGSAKAAWLAAQAVLSEAQRRVKVGATHEVYDSLQVFGKEGDLTLQVGSHGAHRGRPVPLWLEMGTHRQHARPFLRPGAMWGRKVLKAEAEAEVRNACG